MTLANIFELSGTSKRYGSVEAVKNLNLKINSAHRITGFLGCNGAGKSSVIRMLVGISNPSSGTVTVLGNPMDCGQIGSRIRQNIAYVAEDKQCYKYLSVAEMVGFTRSFYQDWNTNLEKDLLAQWDLPLKCKVGALSKGMRTKLALLLALSRRPKLLILDEPTEGLDPVAIEQLLERLTAAAADGTSVFFSSHQISEVERIAHHICIIDRGSLMVDLPLSRIQETTNLRDLFLKTTASGVKR